MDKLAQQSSETLALINDWARSAGEAITNQAPLVVQELLRYRIAIDLLGILFLVLFSILSFWVAKIAKRIGEESEESYNGDPRVCDIVKYIAYIAPLIASLFTIPCIQDLVMVCTAPRLYVLNYALSYLR